MREEHLLTSLRMAQAWCLSPEWTASQPVRKKGKKYRYYTCLDCCKEGRKSKRVSETKAYMAILEGREDKLHSGQRPFPLW